MMWFLLGLALGVVFGVFIVALLTASHGDNRFYEAEDRSWLDDDE